MKHITKSTAAALLCLLLSVTAFADSALELPPIRIPPKASAETRQESPAPTEEPYIPYSGSGVTQLIREEAVEQPVLAEPRTLSEVRAIVGSDVEIINIDGLNVPLSDGSFAYIPFVDIAADVYYTPAVAWAYANNITAGVTELSFGPNATCTRAQMVTFLWRAAGCPEAADTASFTDVVSDSWYAQAVRWAVANGITNGVGDGRFDPNGVVNRAQAVTFLHRAKGSPAATASESFTDVASGAYYEDAVRWAVANEVTNGVGDGAFAPNGDCVRAQTVTFLYRTYAEA